MGIRAVLIIIELKLMPIAAVPEKTRVRLTSRLMGD